MSSFKRSSYVDPPWPCAEGLSPQAHWWRALGLRGLQVILVVFLSRGTQNVPILLGSVITSAFASLHGSSEPLVCSEELTEGVGGFSTEVFCSCTSHIILWRTRFEVFLVAVAQNFGNKAI